MRKKLIKEMLNGSFWIMPATPDFINEGIPYITSKNIKKGQILMESAKYISEEDYNRIAKNRPIETNDILISMIGTLGEAAIVKSEYGNFYGQNVYLLRLNDKKISHKYFLYLMKSSTAKRHFESKMNQSTQKYLKADHIESLEIPDISLNEQIEEAEILDKLNSIIIYREEQLKELDNLIKSQFVEMFGDLKDNIRNYPIKKISDFTEVMTGATPNRGEVEYFNGNIPWVKTGEISKRHIFEAEEYITEKAVIETNCKLLPANTIMMAMYGQGKTRGQVGILEIEATTNQACAAILPNTEYNSLFMLSQLDLRYEDLREMGRGGNQPNLNLSMVKSFEVLYPEIELQNQFATVVQQVDKLKVEVLKSLDETQRLFDSLMQKYFD